MPGFWARVTERRKRRHDFDRFRLERLAKVGERELERQKRAAEFGLMVVPVLFAPTMVEFLKDGIHCTKVELIRNADAETFELRIHTAEGP